MRLDLLDVCIGGNKWFKLRENFWEFRKGDYTCMLSFGGAYSNHLAALAEIGRQQGVRVIGIVRGEEDTVPDTVTLRRARQSGMELQFVSRDLYRRLRGNHLDEFMRSSYPGAYIIPEGGANVSGIKGCKDIAHWIPAHSSKIILAAGTGTTAVGIASVASANQQVLAVKTVEAAQEKNMKLLAGSNMPQQIVWSNEFTGKAYQQPPQPVLDFTREWNQQFFKIEPIYTGRAFYAAFSWLNSGKILESDHPLVIHTGGLQYLTH